ncbi:putative effector protein [Erysiphe necator]|uniref:Putative effector protein n=1 Tax=Uncinula necator TaxID=52586 RepID=A0A0B1NZC1_UNCNE|nr:putative effector protein [Erysiphe necator]
MLEEKHPGVGANFLALLADGASRAMRGERIYTSTENKPHSQQQLRQDPWANKAKINADRIKVFNIKKLNTKSTPPKGHSKEDRRVMIRLAPDHEARKTGTFELRLKVQQLVSDKSIVSDVWSVPSGIAILAPTPAKAAAILQSKTVIEDRFGIATVERQERWTNFIIGPIPKKFQCFDGLRNPLDGLLSEKLASARDTIPIRYMN